ncbi:siderophore-interacting protein [Pusillimonas sp. TS35]|uniref:MucB/RseB C-terminal domain-containing protein n=1 Tax=Paracandidimonas lactea TaxID=2895524 RepID=UPI00136C774E|nr:MucB/RseB C-terminal domain-containing protein [Paracandidimonas lactea]MYN13714.1 siderophore-interacting protein [Pusillimonas sp. TS35]
MLVLQSATGIRPLRNRFARGQLRRASGVLVLALSGLAAAPVVAAPNDAGAQGLVILRQMQDAARKLDYSGVYTYQQGAVMQSSRITHMVDGTGERERIEVLDGEAHEFIRHNEVTQCLVPEQKAIIIERQRGDRFPALMLGDGANIPKYYDIVRHDGTYRVAGRECNLLELRPRDDYRYGYRLCADTRTRLLLKAQVVGPEGLIDQISFNSLSMGAQVASADLESSWNTAGWKVVETRMKPVDLAQAGWRIPAPPGYEPVMQVTRPMRKGREASQLLLTDGLAAVSVFIEPHKADERASQLNEAVRTGAMNIYRTRIGDYWLTALGEVPADALLEIAKGTQFVPADDHKN